MKLKIKNVSIGRDAIGRWNILWLRVRDEGDMLAFSYEALRPYPPLAGRIIAVTPRAFAENPAILAEAFIRVAKNAVETHKLLKRKGKGGLRLESLEFFYTAPEPHEPFCNLATCPEQHPNSMNHLIAWKAMSR